MLLSRGKSFEEFRINLLCLTCTQLQLVDMMCSMLRNPSTASLQNVVSIRSTSYLIQLTKTLYNSSGVYIFPTLQQSYPFRNTDLCIQVTPTSMALRAHLFRSTGCSLRTIRILKSKFICLQSAPQPQFMVFKAFPRAPGQTVIHCSAVLANVNWRWRRKFLCG